MIYVRNGASEGGRETKDAGARRKHDRGIDLRRG